MGRADGGAVDGLLRLQETGGNQMVLRLLASARSDTDPSNDGLTPRIRALLGRGDPLPAGPRELMRSELGHSFDQVRVHTDGESASLAGELGAQAFTAGQDVFFGAGKYNPGTREGDALLAHELVHTTQDPGGVTARPAAPGLVVSRVSDPDERAAADVARQVTADRTEGPPFGPATGGRAAAPGPEPIRIRRQATQDSDDDRPTAGTATATATATADRPTANAGRPPAGADLPPAGPTATMTAPAAGDGAPGARPPAPASPPPASPPPAASPPPPPPRPSLPPAPGPGPGASVDLGAGLATAAGSPPGAGGGAGPPPPLPSGPVPPVPQPAAVVLPPRLPDSAPTPQQDAAVAQIRAGYEVAAARLDAMLAQVLARSASIVDEQLATLEQTTNAQIAEVTSGAAAARAEILNDAAAAQDRLGQAAAANRDEVLAWRTGAVAAADATLQERQATVITGGQQRAEQAQQAATEAADTARTEAQSQSQQADAIGAAKAASPTSGEAEVRSAQAAAARQLAGDTSGTVGSTAANTATGMANQGAQVAGGLQNLAGQVATDLTGHRQSIVDHLGEQETQTVSALAGTADAGGRALGQRRDAALAAVDRSEAEAIAALRQQAARQRESIVQAGQQTAEHLGTLGADAGSQLAGGVERAVGAFVAQPVDEETSATAAGTATVQLTAAADQILGALDARTGELTAALVAATGDGTDQLRAAGSGATGGLRQTGEQGSAGVLEAANATQDSLAATVRQTRTAGDTAVSTFTGVLDQNVSAAMPGLDSLLADHRSNLTDQVTEVRTKSAEPTSSLGGRIDAAQQRAAERAERSWLGNQLADLWDTVTSPEFLVGLAVGLVVGIIIIASAGTATPFVIMAAGIAAGAAGAAAGTMTGNIREGKRGWDVFDNVGRNALIGGLAGGVGAAVYLFGAGVAAGLGLTGTAAAVFGFVTLEVAAVVSNTVANIASGRPWDENLLTAILLAPLVELIGRALPGPRRARGPVEEGEPPPGQRRRPTPQGEEEPQPVQPDEEGQGKGRQPDGPEGITDEDFHIEDGQEPTRKPGDPELDPAICFPAGTLVATPEGPRPIEEIAADSFVHAFDFATGDVVTRQVLGLVRGSTTRWTAVEFAGETVRATPSHRFWVESAQDWIPAEKLAPGMDIRLRGGEVAAVVAVSEIVLDEPEATFNLSVEDAENYFVGLLELLVHNITASRMAYMRRPGYRNYVLRDATGKIYYSGMCRPGETAAGLARRHGANHNRFNAANGDVIEFLPGSREYGEARLLEHRTAVDNGTIIGRDGENYRGNRQDPINADKMPEYAEYEQVKRGCG